MALLSPAFLLICMMKMSNCNLNRSCSSRLGLLCSGSALAHVALPAVFLASFFFSSCSSCSSSIVVSCVDACFCCSAHGTTQRAHQPNNTAKQKRNHEDSWARKSQPKFSPTHPSRRKDHPCPPLSHALMAAHTLAHPEQQTCCRSSPSHGISRSWYEP